MKKFIACIPLLLSMTIVLGQKVSGGLKFGQGQILEVNLQLKTSIAQQAMGQAIDFDLDGSALHLYKITNATGDNTTLHHEMKQVAFDFDGMGQKLSFDSNKEKDMNGLYGKPIKEMLGKTFDMIVDPGGKVLMVQPEKMDTANMDDRLAIISSMLKDVFDIVQPPKKGSGSFFKVLPENETGKNDSWADTLVNESVRSITSYTITDINDSTIIIDLAGNSITTSKAEMMGNETITTMNNKTTGKILIDRSTGIIREKRTTTESHGSTEVMGTSLPVTSKTTVVITVHEKK